MMNCSGRIMKRRWFLSFLFFFCCSSILKIQSFHLHSRLKRIKQVDKARFSSTSLGSILLIRHNTMRPNYLQFIEQLLSYFHSETSKLFNAKSLSSTRLPARSYRQQEDDDLFEGQGSDLFVEEENDEYSSSSTFFPPVSSQSIQYTDEDYEFQQNYRKIYNYTFDRSANPNISLTVSFTIDKLAVLLSNPTYLNKYALTGVYALLDENHLPIYINYAENMIPTIFQKLKEIQALKKLFTTINQPRKLSFTTDTSTTNNKQEIESLQVSGVKMEIFPKLKINTLEKVTISVIKRIKPILNKILQQNEEEIKVLMTQASTPSSPSSKREAAAIPSVKPEITSETPNVVSPFQNQSNRNPQNEDDDDDDDDEEDDGRLELNKENVDKVLEQVRPYLMADGGNVEVVTVNAKEGAVELILQGACGSCPSSTTTMKLGIERVLKENFPNIQSVVAINAENAKPKTLTVEIIEELLKKLLPTIEKLGGKLHVHSVESTSGAVKVVYSGPEKLRKGIDLILKENDLVKRVEYVAAE